MGYFKSIIKLFVISITIDLHWWIKINLKLKIPEQHLTTIRKGKKLKAFGLGKFCLPNPDFHY